jgi:hypothetical protein
LFVDDRRAGSQRCFGVDDRRQILKLCRHQRGSVFGQIAIFRDYDGERFADMPHLVVRQQRLLWIVELVLDKAPPFARQRELRVGDRR